MIGTAPNAYAVGFIQSTYGVEVSFDWMRFGVPLMLIMVPGLGGPDLSVYPVDFRMTDEIRGIMRRDLTALGPVSTTEKRHDGFGDRAGLDVAPYNSHTFRITGD